MAFCKNCGQQMADGMSVCPACGAPQQPVYPQQPQAPAYPQQPQAPAYPQQPQAPVYPQQPQQPVYQQAPQQPVYPQQPQAPVYPQQPAFQQPQRPMGGAPEHLDSLPSANSANMMIFVIVGIVGALLTFGANFVNVLEKTKYILELVGAGCTGVAMYYFYDSLKKGLVGHKEPMTGLLTYTCYTLIGYYALLILTTIIILTANSFSSLGSAGALGVLAGLVGLAYFVMSIIVASKLVNNYTGKVKNLGVMIIAYPIVMIVSALIGFAVTVHTGGVDVFGIIMGLLSAGISTYIYILAAEIIGGKKLI